MKGNFLIAFIIATLVFSVDRYTKNWVSKNFRIGESKSVYKDYIKITHIKNPWVAWGLKIFGFHFNIFRMCHRGWIRKFI